MVVGVAAVDGTLSSSPKRIGPVVIDDPKDIKAITDLLNARTQTQRYDGQFERGKFESIHIRIRGIIVQSDYSDDYPFEVVFCGDPDWVIWGVDRQFCSSVLNETSKRLFELAREYAKREARPKLELQESEDEECW
jgi:hypothetical protein